MLAGRKPADGILQACFKAHHCGSRDRAQIGGLVYGVLRDFRRLEWLCGGCEAEALVEASLTAKESAAAPEDVRLNLPADLYPLLKRQYGEALPALADSLNREAPVDLRVNSLRGSREEALERLAAEGITAQATALSPVGLRLAKRVALHATRSYKDGWVEPQDEGSQLLALLLAPKPGERVCDYCAGAGGKTLALGALMGNTGELLACDVSQQRLQKLAERLPRSGLDIVQTWLLRGDSPPASAFDAVLVDAPCSATGTWRRNPELRLRPLDLPALAAQQLEILSAAATLVRPGGRLVYATCSLLREENEAVVERFLAQARSFRSAAAQRAGLSLENGMLRLSPHREGTDGFFAWLGERSG